VAAQPQAWALFCVEVVVLRHAEELYGHITETTVCMLPVHPLLPAQWYGVGDAMVEQLQCVGDQHFHPGKRCCHQQSVQ
jgi:hypothetical protein